MCFRPLASRKPAHARFCGGDLVRHEGTDDEETDVWTWTHYECDRCGTNSPVAVSDVESVRRAMRTLAKSERVELAWIQTPGVGGGPMPDWSRQLHARLPLTDEEAEREHAEHKQPDVFDLMPWGAREAFWRSVVGQPAKGGGDG